MSEKLGIINYGSGNFSSVWNAFTHLKFSPHEITQADQLEGMTHLVLPGVGSFPACMKKLESMDIIEPLRKAVMNEGVFFLGICVGMQVLSSQGFEFEKYRGLNFVEGEVPKLEVEKMGLRLPHIGWNECMIDHSSPLWKGFEEEKATFYFVHSYHFQLKDPSYRIAYCDYGAEVTAAIGKGNIFGVQFHPEKSQHDGLRLLKNFANMRRTKSA